MDYSNYIDHILRNYLINGVCVLGSVVGVIGISLEAFKHFRKANKEKSNFKFLFFNNKSSIIDFLGFFGITAIMSVGWIWAFGNFIQDIPYVINNEYIITTGVSTGWDNSGEEDYIDQRTLCINEFSTGENIEILVNYTPINQGDVYKVMYLPNTKFGVIIEKIESPSDDVTSSDG